MTSQISMVSQASAVSIDMGASRNYAEEHESLAVVQGIISQADAIIKNWEHSEFLIRRTIVSINDYSGDSNDFTSQIRLLKDEGTKLTKLFDQIGEILLNEPTCFKVKQSTILGWGTSVAGFLSGGAGLGTIVKSYMSDSVPSLAPIILTASGVAVVGFQILFWNKMKQDQEDRTKLLVLRARFDVITEAREMAKLLQKVMRVSRTRAESSLESDRKRDDLFHKIRLHQNRCAKPEDERDPLGYRAASAQRTSSAAEPQSTERNRALRFAYTPRRAAPERESIDSDHAVSQKKAAKEKAHYSAQAMIESMRIPTYEESYTNSIEAQHVTFHASLNQEDNQSTGILNDYLSHSGGSVTSAQSGNSANGSDKSVDIFAETANEGSESGQTQV